MGPWALEDLVGLAASLALIRLALVRDLCQIMDQLAVQVAVGRQRALPVRLFDSLCLLDALVICLCGRVLELLHDLEDRRRRVIGRNVRREESLVFGGFEGLGSEG